MALDKIELMIRTAQRLETVFMIDVTSSDMALLNEEPETMFDGERMVNAFELIAVLNLGGGI